MYSQALDLNRFSSIQAVAERETLSKKYSFIPTTKVIRAFEQKGWLPVKASEVRAKEERKGFQKHLIRFRHQNSEVLLNEIHPEIVLTNSHDGLASFKIMAGMFRLVCLNGLIISDATFSNISIRHMGYTDHAVHQAIEQISDSIPGIAKNVKEFQEIELTPDEQGIFAQAALAVKYSTVEEREFDILRLLAPVRRVDDNPTLWSTFNTVQEKLIKGGRYEKKPIYTNMPGLKNITKTGRARAVNSITEDVRINKGLWLLTEKMAELKRSA